MLGLQTPTVPPQGPGVWEGAHWTGNSFSPDGTVANAVIGQAAVAAQAADADRVDEVPVAPQGGWGFIPNRPLSTNNGIDNGWPIDALAERQAGATDVHQVIEVVDNFVYFAVGVSCVASHLFTNISRSVSKYLSPFVTIQA